MRRKIRAQIASRDGEILYEIALMHQTSEPADEEFDASIDSPANQVTFLLKISRLPRLKDAMAIRLFDVAGKFVDAFPAYVTEASLSEEDLHSLKRLRPVSHFYAQRRLAENFSNPKSDIHGEQSIPISKLLSRSTQRMTAVCLGVAQHSSTDKHCQRIRCSGPQSFLSGGSHLFDRGSDRCYCIGLGISPVATHQSPAG
jgi:hypothetical protein